MGLLGARTYDRSRLLSQAQRAAALRRRCKAIALYRQVLAREPTNAELHGKLAPLLAARGERFDAWISFHIAGQALRREGLIEKAIGTYRAAAQSLPRQIEAWLAIARLERERKNVPEAAKTLLAARRHFRGRRLRPQAIYLLRRALELEPGAPETALALSRLLARSRQRPEAAWLLESAAERARGATLRRIRAAQWRLEPSLAHSWLWLCAAFSPRPPARRPARAAGRSS
jgi:tetratricopeptide (TPR) repeat protein